MIFHLVASMCPPLRNIDARHQAIRSRLHRCTFSSFVSNLTRVFEYLLVLLMVNQLTWAGESPRTSQVENTDATQNAAEFAHARELLRQGKYNEAITELRQLSQSHPGMEGLSHELGVAYYKKSDYMAAIEQFKQALEKDPHDTEATQLLGLSYYLSGRPADAIPFLERVQTWYPRANVDASYILGQCYIQTKDYAHARQAFGKMFDLPPNSAGSYLLTARMLFRQEFEPVALEYAQKAVELDPKLPLAHFLLGEIHLFQSQIPEAVQDFQRELALNPGHAATYYKLADAYSRILKFDDAERLLQRSIWLDPTSTGPYILMGKVLEKKSEPQLAIRALQRAASMDPNNSMTHHLLGQAYRDLGRNEEAERELKIANQLQSTNDSQP
jgi:tetratricopeptide (TPR) repeat protein